MMVLGLINPAPKVVYAYVEPPKTALEAPFTPTVQSALTPQENPLNAPPKSIEEKIREKAREYKVDPELAVRISKCESGLVITAKNKTSSASGLYQWLDSSFLHYAKIYNLPLDKKNDPDVQIELTMKVLKDGGISNWNESKSCWSKFK